MTQPLDLGGVASTKNNLVSRLKMTQRTLFLIAAAVFSLIALGHAIRLLFGWHVMIENVVLPSATI